MKIIICYPPLSSVKGTPLLSQNRQFQYFKDPTFIYPVVPATAASMLKRRGYDVIWLDCIAAGISYSNFLERIKVESSDLIAIETKTPVVQEHWKIIGDIKQCCSNAKTVLFGDHVTALPEESFHNSQVDFVLTGGDYDFLLVNLCEALSQKSPQWQSRLEPGIWFRDQGKVTSTGQFQLNHDLDSLPVIDRDLTQWKLYAYKNGNYRRTPGTYIMSGRDCWWGKCTFCSWPQLYPRYRIRSVKNVLEEIEHISLHYPVKEIMDDSGSLSAGDWLHQFCEGIFAKELHRRLTFDCNMRFGALGFSDYQLMRKAGFRFLLFGIESANQKTLDRLDKGLTVETIVNSCKEARRAGLYPHITIMFGYPWETYEEACKTLELGKWLLKKDYAYTMQATIVIPYPGTKLYEECKAQHLLESVGWSYYDMKNPVMKLPFPKEKLHQLVQGMYSVSFSPEFLMRKICGIRDLDDFRYFGRAFSKVIGHLFDFKARENHA